MELKEAAVLKSSDEGEDIEFSGAEKEEEEPNDIEEISDDLPEAQEEGSPEEGSSSLEEGSSSLEEEFAVRGHSPKVSSSK
jgi:hypothetical protein